MEKHDWQFSNFTHDRVDSYIFAWLINDKMNSNSDLCNNDCVSETEFLDWGICILFQLCNPKAKMPFISAGMDLILKVCNYTIQKKSKKKNN